MVQWILLNLKVHLELNKKIRDGDISLEMAEEDQEKFKIGFSQIKSGNPKQKSEMQLYTIKNVKNLYESRQEIIDLFNNYSKIKSESVYRSKQNETKGKGLKVLTPKQMLQRLPIVLAQVKAGNNLESLLNEIRQIVFSLCQPKQITQKVYNNIIKSMQWNFTQICVKMDTIFMNSENSKKSKPHVLTVQVTNKLDLRIGENGIALSRLSILLHVEKHKNLIH